MESPTLPRILELQPEQRRNSADQKSARISSHPLSGWFPSSSMRRVPFNKFCRHSLGSRLFCICERFKPSIFCSYIARTKQRVVKQKRKARVGFNPDRVAKVAKDAVLGVNKWFRSVAAGHLFFYPTHDAPPGP